MGTRLNPYINYNGTARQAFEFYRGVFGGELVINTFGEFGASGTEDADKVMHAMLETPQGLALMGSDTPSYLEFTPGNTMSVSLSGEDSAELHGFFDQLAEGGSVTTPLEKQVWGDEFGMVTDQFGVAWMVNISQPQG